MQQPTQELVLIIVVDSIVDGLLKTRRLGKIGREDEIDRIDKVAGVVLPAVRVFRTVLEQVDGSCAKSSNVPLVCENEAFGTDFGTHVAGDQFVEFLAIDVSEHNVE